MTPTERLFRQLVAALEAAREPLDQAIQVSEIYQRFVPYRTSRSKLGVESVDTYELALLKLLGGEGGYVTIEPPEAQQAIKAEAESVNPDTGFYREFAGARVRLDAGRVAEVLAEHLKYAPREEAGQARDVGEVASPAPPAPPAPPPAPTSPASSRCPDCGSALPAHRTIVFCPYCARQLRPTACRRCGDEIEPGWQYCATCGQPVNELRG